MRYTYETICYVYAQKGLSRGPAQTLSRAAGADEMETSNSHVGNVCSELPRSLLKNRTHSDWEMSWQQPYGIT